MTDTPRPGRGSWHVPQTAAGRVLFVFYPEG